MKRFGPFLLDAANQALSRGAERVDLSPKTFAVLRHLVENCGRLLRHEELLAAVWPNTFVQPEILKTHIRVLRKALADSAETPRFIETRARLGYRFIAEVAEEAPGAGGGATGGLPVAPDLPGRAVPMARLRAALDATLRGERRFLFVTGEAGSGKTALLDALAAEAEAGRDLWIGVSRGRPRPGAEPLQPLLEMLGDWCRSPGGAAVRQLLGLHAPGCRLLLASAMGPPGRERRRPAGEGGAGVERALREIVDVLEAMAEQRPLLLLLDDLHWMDEATLALLSILARRPGRRRILVVAAARPAPPLPPRPALRRLMLDLLVHRAAEEVTLAPLQAAEIAQWLAAQAEAPPAALTAFLHAASDGNPMLAGAILDHLLEGGLVRREAGWRLTQKLSPGEARGARRVQQMLDLEFEDLSPEQRQVLEAASIAGRQFCSWSVVVVLDMPAATAEDHCRSLCQHNLLRELAEPVILPNGIASPRFAFVHGVFRDILHQRQAAARRAVWHRRLGERAEANWGSRAPVIAAELAYRFREGQDWRRAILYSQHAAREALQTSGPAEALRLLRRAMEGCRHLPEAERAGVEAALQREIAGLARPSLPPGARPH